MLLEEGFNDILLAFPIVGDKILARSEALAEKLTLRRSVTATRLPKHGYLHFPESLNLSIGEKLTIIPNHSCMLPNLCDELIGVRGEEVVTVFPVSARGKNK